jgi:hypothetical protein
LTDLTPAGRQTRAAAVAGQRGLDPTVRHITQLGNEVERTRDEALNWALSGGRKKQAMLDAVRGEMSAIPDKALPVKSPRVDYDYTYQFPGENTPTIPPPGRIPGPAPTPGGTTYQTGTADDLDFEHIIPETVKRPGAPEFGPDEIGSDTPTIPPAKEKSSIGLMKAQDFASQHGRQLEELAADPDLPSMSKQGIKRLIQLHKTTEAKIAAAFNEEDPAVALRDADHALDIYKQNLGRVTNQLGKSPENKFIYEHLNGMYHELRDHLEDETVWGTALSGKQTRVNAAHTNDFTQRQRFKNTLLTGDSALRSADPFKMRPEVDPAKVSGLLENAGRASNDIKERSMLEGFQSSSNLSDVLTDEYGANDKLRNKVSAQKKAVDDLLSSFADTRKNMTAAREMREVSKESPWLGRGANAMATVEDTIAKNPVLGKLASGAGATAQFASRAAPKYATMGAAEFEARKKNRERGHEIETAVDTALNTNPESLGPFLQRLQEAKQNDKLGTELFKLDADPQWRKLRSQF